MDTMRGALERAKMLVGMEVDEESGLPPPEEQSFFDDINRNCTLNTTQASTHAWIPSSYPPSLYLSPLGSGGPARPPPPGAAAATGSAAAAGTRGCHCLGRRRRGPPPLGRAGSGFGRRCSCPRRDDVCTRLHAVPTSQTETQSTSPLPSGALLYAQQCLVNGSALDLQFSPT